MTDPGVGPGKADLADIPTAELEMLARVGDKDKLEALFHASDLDEKNTVDMVLSEMSQREATSLKIKGEGIPIFTNLIDGVDLRLGVGLSGLARNVWSGKFFTFRLQEDGSLKASLQNAILGTEIINAQVFIATMQEAMERRGEDPPGGEMEKFGLFNEPVEVDTKLSVMLDYELERISLFSTLIDELRPVTEDTLAAAGIEIPAGVGPIEDLWIGRATAVFGFFRPERQFVIYFALHFDRNSMEFDIDE